MLLTVYPFNFPRGEFRDYGSSLWFFHSMAHDPGVDNARMFVPYWIMNIYPLAVEVQTS